MARRNREGRKRRTGPLVRARYTSLAAALIRDDLSPQPTAGLEPGVRIAQRDRGQLDGLVYHQQANLDDTYSMHSLLTEM